MEAKDCIIGTKVGVSDTGSYSSSASCIGTIISHLTKTKIWIPAIITGKDPEEKVFDAVVVEFPYEGDDETFIEKVPIHHLITVEAFLIEKEKAEQKQAGLEKEYESIRPIIADKIKQASDMILEADRVAKTVEAGLKDFYNETGPLFNALGSAGWRTSSMSC